MPETKKVLHTGRFGPRYGRGVKSRVLKVELEQRKKHECPFCEKPKVKRKAAGLFECLSCHASFAGGAYTPVTMSGKIVNRVIRQKQFNALETEITQLKDTQENLKLKEKAEHARAEKAKIREKLKEQPAEEEVSEENL